MPGVHTKLLLPAETLVQVYQAPAGAVANINVNVAHVAASGAPTIRLAVTDRTVTAPADITLADYLRYEASLAVAASLSISGLDLANRQKLWARCSLADTVALIIFGTESYA